MAGQLHHSAKGWKVAIHFFSLTKASAGYISINQIWFGGTSGHWEKQLDLSNDVRTKNLGKEQKENFCQAPVDNADLTIGGFCWCTTASSPSSAQGGEALGTSIGP